MTQIQVLLHAWAELEGAGSEAASSTDEEGLTYLDPASGRVVTVDHRTGVRVRALVVFGVWCLGRVAHSILLLGAGARSLSQCCLGSLYILQAVVAEADAPRAAASEVEIEGVAEALAGYVAAQYATEAVRACITCGI